MSEKQKGPLLSIESIVSAKDGQPYVQYSWSDFRAQMTPEEATRHALILVEAANAAIGDAFLMTFLTEKLDLQPAAAAPLIAEFRQCREQRRAKDQRGSN
jgi:hypothetical protein